MFDFLYSSIISFIFGIFTGVISTLIVNKIIKNSYLRRKKGLPQFDLTQSFTFSDSGDNRILEIISKNRENLFIKCNFFIDKSCRYAGIVIKPSNPYFTPYAKKNYRLSFFLETNYIEEIELEIKSCEYKEVFSTIYTYKVKQNNKDYSILLKNMCSNLEMLNNVHEIVFLIRYYHASTLSSIQIKNIKISQ